MNIANHNAFFIQIAEIYCVWSEDPWRVITVHHTWNTYGCYHSYLIYKNKIFILVSKYTVGVKV